MKKQDLFIKGAAALVALIAVSGIATASFAFNGEAGPPSDNNRGFNRMENMTEQERQEWQEDREARRAAAEERQEAVREALEAQNYQAWLEAVGDDFSITEKINEDNFSRLVELHELHQEAENIREELGLERGLGLGMGPSFEHRGKSGCGFAPDCARSGNGWKNQSVEK